MATTTRRIKRISGPIADLNPQQIGVEDSADGDLGYKMWGGKDAAGDETKWLAKDKPAQVETLTITDFAGGGTQAIGVDNTGAVVVAPVPDLQSVYESGAVIEVTGAPVQINGTGGAPALVVSDQNGGSLITAQDQTPTTALVAISADTVNIGGKAGGQTTIEGDGALLLKDGYLTAAVALSETGETALETTAQSIIGAINEIAGATPGLQDLQSVLDNGSSATVAAAVSIGSSGGVASYAGTGVSITATATDASMVAQGANRKVALQALSSGGTVEMDAAGHIDLNAPYVQLDATNTTAPPVGAFAYNSDTGFIEAGVEGGSISLGGEVEDFFSDLDPGDPLIEGEIVSVVGVSGNRSGVARTDATSAQSATACVGMVTHVDGLIRVSKIGRVRGLNTLGMTEGMPVYVDPTTPGGWTQTAPAKGDFFIHVGIVEVASATVGVIAVEVHVVWKLDQLSDVETGAIQGDVLQYQVGDTSVWSPRNLEINSGFRNPEAITGTAQKVPSNGSPEHIQITLFDDGNGALDCFVKGAPAGITDSGSGWSAPKLYTSGKTGAWYLYIDADDPTMTPAWSDTPWSFDDVQIAIALFNSSGTYLFSVAEWHGRKMDADDHRNQHTNIGTSRLSGLDLTGITLNSSTAAHRRPDVSAGVILDEDLPIAIAAQLESDSDYTRMKFSGATTNPTFTTAQADIVETSTGALVYNLNTAGTWSTPTVAINAHTCYWLVAFPQIPDVTAGKAVYRLVWVMGQSTGTLAEMQARTPANVDMGLLATIAPEYCFLQKLIIKRTGASDWQIVQSDRLTGNLRQQIAITGGNYLSQVTTDGVTLEGAGTPASPAAIVTAATITTSDNGTTALTAASVRRQLITGTGSNHVISLPDATTLTAGGAPWEFVNNNSQFVIVKDYAGTSSVYKTVAPGAILTCECTGIGSTAGTWVVVQHIPTTHLYYDNDFLETLANGNAPTTLRCTIGTGSGYYVTGEAYASTKGGDLVMDIGADAGLAGYVNAFILGPALSGTKIMNKGFPLMFRQLITASNLSDGTNTYSARMGFYDVSNGNAPANGAYFETDADGDLIPTTISGSTPSTASEAGKIGTAGTYSDLMIIVNAAATRIDYYVDKVHAGTITTNIPKTVALFVGAQLDRSAGTAGRTATMDRFIFHAARS